MYRELYQHFILPPLKKILISTFLPSLDYFLTFLNLTAINHLFLEILLILEYFISEFGE